MPLNEQLATDLSVGIARRGLISFGNFTLRDGSWSPSYWDVRPVPSLAEDTSITSMSKTEQLSFREKVIEAYSVILDDIPGGYDHLLGIPEAVVSLTGMIGYAKGDSVLYRRVKIKEDHGKVEAILGHYLPGERVALVDDVISTSGAKVDEKNLVERVSSVTDDDGTVIEEGLKVEHAAILIDRETGGIETAKAAGLTVLAALTTSQILQIAHAEGAISKRNWAVLVGYKNREIRKPEDIRGGWYGS